MTTRPVSVLTGAASGIGRHLAKGLHRAGHRLLLLDLDETGLARTVEMHGLATDRNVIWQKLDVRDWEGWSRAAARAEQELGPVDTLLNVAGFLKPGLVHEMAPEVLGLHLDVNAKGVMLGTRAFAPSMVTRGRGHILNVASLAGLSHVPGLAAYCASKHAVRGFSLAVAEELRPLGVSVTVLCPDAVETPMLTLQEAHPEAAMTFGAGRALSLREVEDAVLRALRERPLEIVLDVPGSGRGVAAKLANLFPSLTTRFASHVARRGRAVQEKRTSRG